MMIMIMLFKINFINTLLCFTSKSASNPFPLSFFLMLLLTFLVFPLCSLMYHIQNMVRQFAHSIHHLWPCLLLNICPKHISRNDSDQFCLCQVANNFSGIVIMPRCTTVSWMFLRIKSLIMSLDLFYGSSSPWSRAMTSIVLCFNSKLRGFLSVFSNFSISHYNWLSLIMLNTVTCLCPLNLIHPWLCPSAFKFTIHADQHRLKPWLPW